MRLTLVRHAESEGNVQGLWSGHSDHKLTETGVVQAEAVGQRLASERFDHIYVSDLRRARETAQPIIREHPNTPVTYDARLREKHFGVFEGKRWVENAGHPYEDPVDGEAVAAFHERILRFLDETWENHHDEHVLIVSHGGYITHLFIELAGSDDHKPYRVSNTGVSVVEFDVEKNHTVHLHNCTDHLQK